jgi:cell division protein ZapA
MANVVVTVADRPYTMQCPDGEEDHLRELAALLDTEISRMADRLSEAIRKIEGLEDQIKGLRESRNLAQMQVKDIEAKFADRLERASARLEGIAKGLK